MEQAATKLRWLATCPKDTRQVLEAELVEIGAEVVESLNRGVVFEADLETGYRAHLLLRTASRIQRLIADVPAGTVGELAKQAKEIDWTKWLGNHRPFTVQAILTDRESQSLGESQVMNAVAGAVMERFEAVGRGGAGVLRCPRNVGAGVENAVTVVAHCRNGVCTLGLDTAGRALHKRGWRLNGHPAVIKETLAAAILLLAGYDGTEPVLDPMCGSGTIIIEAAYIALNKAPLIHRGKDDFAIEHLAGFERGLWRKVADQLRGGKRVEPQHPLFARDIRGQYVELARAGALRARVEKHITFKAGAFEELDPPGDHGLLVTNLPYGQRIGRGQLQRSYASVGRVIRERYARWRVALLVPTDGPIEALGLRGARQVKLMNGALPVCLMIRD